VPTPEPEGRRWFGPAVGLGVVGAGLAAFAGSKPWAAPDGGASTALLDKTGGHVPLAGALGLVGLAAWGVLLVTRGVVRRVVAVLGAVVAVGLVATAVGGRGSALDSARHATVNLDQTPTGAHTTAWWVVALIGSVLALLGSALAVRHVRTWPEMGTKYDAPTGPEAPADPSRMEERDLWRAIDEGRDPTDPGDSPDPAGPSEP
jgi:uncharacterized membrane protein (TIGR02234 family)